MLTTFSIGLLSAETSTQDSNVSKEINNIITARLHPYLKLSDFSNRTEDLDSLYKRFNYQLLWLGNPHSSKNTEVIINLLTNASSQGLNPEDYDIAQLKTKLNAALALPQTNYKELALSDTALSIALLRYLHDLHYGRINPQGINFNLQLRDKKTLDIPVLIKDSLTLNTLSKLSELAEPKLEQYQKLKSALAAYRETAAKTSALKFSVKGKLRPGESHPQLLELEKYLVGLGDLAANSAADSVKDKLKYTPDLVAGIKKFQLRHGLGADGTIGPGTVLALNEPLSKRITQIELALERLRWLPELSNVNRSIIVNIPAFQLWAINGADQSAPEVTTMRVVVGKALKNQTPVLMAQMSFIEFSPYWNVPKNILKDEILPKLVRNPGYLLSQNMEIVSSFGNSAKPASVNKDSIEKLKKGLLRVRQKPGGKNSLGKVKFIFPNKDDVYLHDTPANSLFSKSRRDFSHGCVRVENPKALAEFALKNQGKWNADTIQKAMKNPANQRVILQNPIPVLFFYTTTYVDQNNNLSFYPDIYGHDEILIEALKKNDDLSDRSIFVSTSEIAAPPAVNP
ncbi:MAG: L,D-transpeptidase family protein [Methylococcaceae bacterium]|nr:L,D-transpeptidase family protein [Methylococcaceae bacterium]